MREWLPALETAMWAVPGVVACVLLPALAVNLTLLLRMPAPAPTAAPAH
ncbi:hypothetical protein GCM10025773_03040 [Microbacterium jejuense]